jgi:Raf kinase inhibitor-like YbhB/YbcL family protein
LTEMAGKSSLRSLATLALLGLLAGACGGEEPGPATNAGGQDKTDTSTVTTTSSVAEEVTMEVSSSAFEEQGSIPVVYTCDGEDISPPLRIDGIPDGTATLTLIVDDPDAPGGTFDHWIAFDIPPTSEIPENVGVLGTAGTNSFRTTGYRGPCPPSGTHRYMFTVYTLDTQLGLPEGATKQRVLDAAESHVLGQATLTGLYQR